MVMKVKKNRMKIKMTLPPDSQNSASPNARTASTLIALDDTDFSNGNDWKWNG